MPLLLASVTGFLAVYGAILSSVGLGWNLYRDMLDRPKLKLSARVRRFVVSPTGDGEASSEA